MSLQTLAAENLLCDDATLIEAYAKLLAASPDFGSDDHAAHPGQACGRDAGLCPRLDLAITHDK